MGKSTHFFGQPKPQDAEMDEEATDNRFHDHHALLKPDFQGCWKVSQDREEKWRTQGAHGHPCQRGGALRHRFTSAATNDSFMLKPTTLNKGNIMAMDRAYIDYEKFEQLSENFRYFPWAA